MIQGQGRSREGVRMREKGGGIFPPLIDTGGISPVILLSTRHMTCLFRKVTAAEETAEEAILLRVAGIGICVDAITDDL